MHPFDEMKSYVGFTEADSERLARLWDAVAPKVPTTIDRFYAEVLAAPRARAVLRDEAQVERLRLSLHRWVEELLRGPHDHAYHERRQRIGRVHVAVNLPSEFMFTAMSVIRRDLFQLIREEGLGPETVDSLEKITTMDLGIMMGTYAEGRERAELATLRDLIVSHMPVTILLIDREGRISAATRPGTRLFGGANLMGKPLAEAFPAHFVAEANLEHHVARALRSGNQVTITRVDTVIDGHQRSFRLTIVPLNDPRSAALVHVEELTEAVATEARLQRSESLAQLGTFSAAVAHELRNPLAGMRGALQVLAGTFDTEDSRRLILGKVDQQIVRLNELITDLLQFARPPEARLAGLSLRAAADAAVEAVRVEHPDVAYEVRGVGDAVGDERLVQRILVNLVQNAVQATGGAGRVIVIVSPGRVLVNDDGPGVPPEHRERVFKPFFTTRTRGTGLGLAICEQSAHAMGGRVVLAEGPLQGAAFVLDLPVAAD